MRIFRRLLLIFILLIPLMTLGHRNDLGRWELQHSAMAGPDEFSYLLMAGHFLHGGGLSLKESLGRDTFYPPGFPLLLAGWAKFFGLTAFTAHAFNALTLCVDTLLVHILARQIFKQMAVPQMAGDSPRRFAFGDAAQAWMALLIAALFATNWHVLECSLLIMSEPSFMLVIFSWLALALAWPMWPASLRQTAVLALLAIAAWSIRGAGIVCVATTLLYAIGTLMENVIRSRSGTSQKSNAPWRRIGSLALIVAMAIIYQAALTKLSPEKSMTSVEDSANSYPRQLLHGIRDNNLVGLLMSHLNDYASTFIPWPRENPDMHFRDIAGKSLGFFGLLGWLWHIVRRREFGAMRFLELFILLYMGLYLIWPFHFARFWSPIMPLMLLYAVDALVRFTEWRQWMPTLAPAAAMLLLSLTLAGEEIVFKLNDYARRLNYVSDALAESARTILRRSPDPRHAMVLVMNGDDHFALAWYLSQEHHSGAASPYLPQSPQPHVAAKGSKAESPEEMVVRNLRAPWTGNAPCDIYLFSYFAHVDAVDVLSNARRMDPELMDRVEIRKIYQKEMVAAIWELQFRRPSATIDQP